MAKTAPAHFMVYKPYGMLSQMVSNDTRESRTKRFLTELFDFPEGVMPVGRLDEKSEGLILLTTDGKLSDTINRSGIEKEYYAQLDGVITEDALNQLKLGATFGFAGQKYVSNPCSVKRLESLPCFLPADKKIRLDRHRPSSWISITLKEGKFRQVRKMTAAVGFPTLRLVRVRIGTLVLASMSPGMVQQLSDQEVHIAL